jgi:undecaprenyl-diphosphatase
MIIDYIIIGFLQGVIEWLPVSSQGSLVFYISNFLEISPEISLDYSIFLHIGTLLSAMIYFRKELCEVFSLKNIKLLFKYNLQIVKVKEENETDDLLMLRFLFFSVATTFLIAIPIYLFIREKFSLAAVSHINLLIGVLLFVTGFLILFSKKKVVQKYDLSIKNSIILGVAQGFAIIPGLSRSGLTTSALLFRGFSPEKSFRISFLLSIPTMIIGEIGLLFLKGVFFSSYVLISLLVSFIVGYFTIDLLLKFARRINFSYFCFVIGFIYILVFLIG